jgi:hypothetical protein
LNKINDPFTFRLVNNFNVDRLKSIVENFDHEWLIDTDRQNDTVHHTKTFSYFIWDGDIGWVPNTEYVPRYMASSYTIYREVDKIISVLEKSLNGKVGRAMFIKLPAGQVITPHSDQGDYLMAVRRCHIPLITNDDIKFTVGDHTMSLKQGECWEINNSKIHEVKNLSNYDRVHILIDIIPNEYLNGDPYNV